MNSTGLADRLTTRVNAIERPFLDRMGGGLVKDAKWLLSKGKGLPVARYVSAVEE
jgi:hypothetical protein